MTRGPRLSAGDDPIEVARCQSFWSAVLMRMNDEPVTPRWFAGVLTVLLVMGALDRGSELLAGPLHSSSALAAYVNVLGPHVYGCAFLLAGFLLLIGSLTRRLGPYLLGATAVGAVSFWYAVAVLQAVQVEGRGWSAGIAALLAAILAFARIATLLPAVRCARR